MAWLNPFRNREQKVIDSEQSAIDSIAREIERSETPTGAINTLSTKVRRMVDAVASRIRSVVGGSSDMAKATVLAAAAASASAPIAHAWEEHQNTQPLWNNLQWEFVAPNFTLSGGVLQSDDAFWWVVRAKKSDADSAIGAVVSALPDSSQVGLIVAKRLTYAHPNEKHIDDQEKNLNHWGGGRVDAFESSGTTYSVGLTLNQTNAQKVFGPNVGKWPLEAASVQVNSYTNLGAWWWINLVAWMDKAFDRRLAHTTQTEVQTYIKDYVDRIETWQDSTTTTNDQEYIGYEKRYAQFGVDLRLDDHHAIGIKTGAYSLTLPSSSKLQTSGSDGRFDYTFADGTTNLRFGANFDTDSRRDTTYNASWAHRIGRTPIAVEISWSKTDSMDNAAVSVGVVWRPGQNNPLARNVAQLIGRTPEGAVDSFLYQASNPGMYSYEKGEVKDVVTKTPTVSTLLSTQTKNIIAAPVITVQDSLHFVAGTTVYLDVTVSGAANLDVTQTGNVVATKFKESTSPDGNITYILQVSSPTNDATTGTIVLRTGGVEKVVAVSVAAKNKAPNLNSDAEVTDWETPVVVDVLANDIDPENDTLTLTTISSDPTQAVVSIADNKISVVPIVGVAGNVIVQYTVQDAQGNESKGTLTVNIKKPPVIEIIVSSSSVVVHQSDSDVVEPITLTTNESIHANNIEFSLPEGVTMVQQSASANRTLNLFSIEADSFELASETTQEPKMGQRNIKPELEPTKNSLNYNIVVSSWARPGMYHVTARTVIDGRVKEIKNLFVLTIQEKKQVENAPTITRAPTVTFESDASYVSVINNISDDDGISNIVYVVVDAYGNEMPQSSPNFADLKPGDYTVYTQALAFNPTNGNSELVTSKQSKFTIEAPKMDSKTLFETPVYTIDQSTQSVRVMSAGITDADGNRDYQYYLIASGVRIASSDGRFVNIPAGTYTLEIDASVVDGSNDTTKVVTNPNKPTITIEAPKVDAPTVTTQIIGAPLSDNSFQITSSGISDADGEITSLLYIATNTRTNQQLVNSNGRFENLDWGDWVVVATGMAKDGATGELKSVTNTHAYEFRREELDTIAPTLTLNGDTTLRLIIGSAYRELGATAIDNKDGDVSTSIQTTGIVDMNTVGTYTRTYTVTDKVGNTASLTRTIIVETPPDPAPIAPAGSAFANLTDMIASDKGWFSNIKMVSWPDEGNRYIRIGDVTDSLGRPIVYTVTWLPPWVVFDPATERIQGVYDVLSTLLWYTENFTITITATPEGSSHSLIKTFTLGIRNDG